MALFVGREGVLLQRTAAKQELKGKTLVPQPPQELPAPARVALPGSHGGHCPLACHRFRWRCPPAEGHGFSSALASLSRALRGCSSSILTTPRGSRAPLLQHQAGSVDGEVTATIPASAGLRGAWLAVSKTSARPPADFHLVPPHVL